MDIFYNDNIEREFRKLELTHEYRAQKGATGCRDVLQFLIDNPKRIWWWSWELNGQTNSKGAFLSHRACARASDLALKHEGLVEDRRIGRFKVYRAMLENKKLIDKFLSQ